MQNIMDLGRALSRKLSRRPSRRPASRNLLGHSLERPTLERALTLAGTNTPPDAVSALADASVQTDISVLRLGV